ncbi:MAG TPA: hypothetical protein VJ850_07025 [Candidatus Limnocylindrales bacterium]|nr:hypothetical protein [Candidatus Limnocylindrales bacterium]
MFGRGLATGMAIVALVAACGGGGGPAQTGGPGSTDDGGAVPTFNAGGGGGGGGGGNQVSGAKVRVFNAWSPDGGTGGSVDVYGDAFVGADSKALIAVPYGTLTDFFDPGVFDTEGDAMITFLPAGVKDQAKVLMNQSETLKAGDVLTIYLGTGSKNSDGTTGAFDQVYFHKVVDGGGANTPPPGKSMLIVTSSGLDAIMTSQADRTWYVGIGSGCEPGLGSGPGITTTVSPGATGAEYDIAPGSYTVAIYSEPSDQAGTCTGEPIAQAHLDAKANERAVFILYAPKDGQLTSQMIPLEP